MQLTEIEQVALERLRADIANRDEFMLTCRVDKLADMFTAVRIALREPPAKAVTMPTSEGLWWLNWTQLWRVSRFDAEKFTGHVIHPPGVKTVGYELPPGHWLPVPTPTMLSSGVLSQVRSGDATRIDRGHRSGNRCQHWTCCSVVRRVWIGRR